MYKERRKAKLLNSSANVLLQCRSYSRMRTRNIYSQRYSSQNEQRKSEVRHGYLKFYIRKGK